MAIGEHRSNLKCFTWTHDVGSGQNELDRALVDPLVRQHERVLVQQLQGRAPGSLPLPEKQQLAAGVDQKFQVFVALDQLESVLLGQNSVDEFAHAGRRQEIEIKVIVTFSRMLLSLMATFS